MLGSTACEATLYHLGTVGSAAGVAQITGALTDGMVPLITPHAYFLNEQSFTRRRQGYRIGVGKMSGRQLMTQRFSACLHRSPRQLTGRYLVILQASIRVE